MKALAIGFLLTPALALGLVGSANAGGQITSGLMWGGTTQTNAVCYIRNVGTSPIVIVDAKIVNDSNVDKTVLNGCSTIPPGSSCGLSAGLGTNEPVACEVTVGGSTKKVRGAMDIRRDSGGVVTILNQEDLR